MLRSTWRYICFETEQWRKRGTKRVEEANVKYFQDLLPLKTKSLACLSSPNYTCVCTLQNFQKKHTVIPIIYFSRLKLCFNLNRNTYRKISNKTRVLNSFFPHFILFTKMTKKICLSILNCKLLHENFAERSQ